MTGFLRYDNITHKRKDSPMKHFTQEELKPSERTLNIIRQLAYTYRVINVNGHKEVYCMS